MWLWPEMEKTSGVDNATNRFCPAVAWLCWGVQPFSEVRRRTAPRPANSLGIEVDIAGSEDVLLIEYLQLHFEITVDL
jgi:hypothetical protein